MEASIDFAASHAHRQRAKSSVTSIASPFGSGTMP
jgi:hypothetical protein